MAYEVLATSDTPALIIYLLDVSGSMNLQFGNMRRIDVLMDALSEVIRKLIYRSTKGAIISSRYRIAMIAYSDEPYDLLEGVKPIDYLATLGVPELMPMRLTSTARAFAAAEQILLAELRANEHCPAPLVCHLTDGEYTGENPEPIVRRIQAMRVPDGPILVENIFISDSVVPEAIDNPHEWRGILPETVLTSDYARRLRAMSSPLPETYRERLRAEGYRLDPGALMMLPGQSVDLVSLGFQMSGLSGLPVSPSRSGGW
jgi:hypothetical protein